MKIETRGLYKIKSELTDEMMVVADSLEDAIKIFRHVNGTAYYILKVERICVVDVALDND